MVELKWNKKINSAILTIKRTIGNKNQYDES
jgi:hypothetical protein